MHIRVAKNSSMLSKQLNDRPITIEAIRSNFSMDQRTAINKVWLSLKVFYASDLLVAGTKNIKHCYKMVLEDLGTHRSLHWPNVILNKKEIKMWQMFIKRISHRDGSITHPIRWVHAEDRHR